MIKMIDFKKFSSLFIAFITQIYARIVSESYNFIRLDHFSMISS